MLVEHASYLLAFDAANLTDGQKRILRRESKRLADYQKMRQGRAASRLDKLKGLLRGSYSDAQLEEFLASSKGAPLLDMCLEPWSLESQSDASIVFELSSALQQRMLQDQWNKEKTEI